MLPTTVPLMATISGATVQPQTAAVRVRVPVSAIVGPVSVVRLMTAPDWKPPGSVGESPQLAVTATSAPCLGLFQPLDFASVAGSALITPEEAPVEDSLWWRFEAVHRRALVDSGFRQALRRSRDEVEAALWSGAFAALDQQYALAWHARWSGEAQNGSLPLPRWWRRNARL